MDKTFIKRLFFVAIFTLFTLTGAFAQTITVGNVNPAPNSYGQGSTIAVPITVNDATGCINQSNTFNLYLSDASGNFAPGTLIGTSTGFYTTFINGVIPNTTPAGLNYKVRVQTTNPVTTSVASGAFEIKATPGVTPSLSSSETVSTGVFGRCVGSTSPFTITPASAGTVTADFFNESTQVSEASNVPIMAGGYAFNPTLGNYTVTSKSVNAGIVGTYDYQLINNIVVNPFSPFGTNFVCIPSGGSGDLQFVIGTTGPGGIVNNYPGTTYSVDWGDGTNTVFTYCQIAALGGILTHTYSLPSCGQTTSTGATNSLLVASHAISPYCLELASPTTTSAKVIITPTIAFNLPGIACANTAITVTNNSDPGPDYNTSVQSACNSKNPNALYDWYFDGILVASNKPLSYSYVITAAQATPGPHTMKLHAVAPSGTGAAYCQAADVTLPICFEKKPTASFTILSPVCITSMPVSVNNTSIVDVSPTSCNPPAYTWSVTPATFGFAGGTNKNSVQPQFTFSAAGTYTVNLSIPSSCGAQTAVQTIVVQSTPDAVLSADASFCGTNQTLTFDATAGSQTQTTLSGTSATDTYAWTVTAAKGGTTYSFAGGTSASSQYPQILFKDYDTYTIIVSHTNSCGTVISTQQQLTFVQPPLVDVGIDQTVCASSPVVHNLHGTISGAYTSLQWVTSGNGSFSAGTSSTTDYTPSPQDILAGQVTLTLQVTNAAPCNIVSDDLILNITPTAFITSPPAASFCSGQPLNYTITANNVLATFAWTASVTSGTATGFTASGTSANINDVLTNTGSTDAVVTYHILPTIGSCPGTPFVLTVTVHPLPVLTIPAPLPVCNNQPAGVVLTSNVIGTTYTWTSTAGANISGNSTQSTPTAINSIQDILNNSGMVAQTVTYVVTPYNGTCPGTPVTTVVTVESSVIPSVVGPDQEICSTTAPYTLPGNNPAPFTGKWTQVDANPAVTFSDNTKFNATVTGLLGGNTYHFQWTITGAPACPASSSIFTLKIDNPAVGGTATPSPAEVCSGSGSQITLTGYAQSVVQWELSTDGTNWSVISTPAGATTFVTAALTQTTYYRALVQYGANCPNVYSSTATVTVDQPPTLADAGPNDEICNSSNPYPLQGNVPASGTGKWTQDINNPPGANFVDATSATTNVIGLVPGRYIFTWTITASAFCPPSAKSVTIKVDSPPVGGTTAGIATVCYGVNSGQIALTGQTGSVKEWQSSTDGVNYFTLAGAGTGTTMSYAQLTQTTYYRALITNGGVCPDVYSTPTKITVNPTTPAANAGPDQGICNQNYADMAANDPGPLFTGVWTQTTLGPAVTIVNPNDPHTRITGLIRGNSYTFKWTIMGLPPCGNTEDLVNINATADVIPSFTMDQNHNCGNLSVNFTNTSTPSPTGTFLWNFGDGSPVVTAVNPPAHTFPPSTDGTEKTYRITLTPISNCGSQAPYYQDVTVSPQKPVAKILPNQTSACGTFTLVVKNLSPGLNTQYDFYLLDSHGTIIEHLRFTDTRDAVFQTIIPTVTADYSVYLTVTDQCGNQASSTPITISVAPSSIASLVQIKGDVKSVCLGSPVTFQNISTGGNRFTITVYDANKNVVLTLPAGTGDTNYTPTSIGTYYVSITAGNDGCGNAPESALKQFSVYPIPDPSFTYTSDKDYNVAFNNTTLNAGDIPASSVTYKWDFGDGSPTDNSYVPPTHHFDFAKSPFTITLTATTPGTTCSAMATKTIDIKFLGNLFLPNAFIPAGSNPELKVFKAKGFGIKTWRMQIFNNFGQLIWESTKLDSNGSPLEGWDGTYKGQIVEQGVYIWQITATLLNGEEWKGMSYNHSSASRTGAIHLIR
jgi:PKD repeat protein